MSTQNTTQVDVTDASRKLVAAADAQRAAGHPISPRAAIWIEGLRDELAHDSNVQALNDIAQQSVDAIDAQRAAGHPASLHVAYASGVLRNALPDNDTYGLLTADVR